MEQEPVSVTTGDVAEETSLLSHQGEGRCAKLFKWFKGSDEEVNEDTFCQRFGLLFKDAGSAISTNMLPNGIYSKGTALVGFAVAGATGGALGLVHMGVQEAVKSWTGYELAGDVVMCAGSALAGVLAYHAGHGGLDAVKTFKETREERANVIQCDPRSNYERV